jgi:hypothetical protein
VSAGESGGDGLHKTKRLEWNVFKVFLAQSFFCDLFVCILEQSSLM